MPIFQSLSLTGLPFNDEFTYLSHNYTIFNPFQLTVTIKSILRAAKLF